MKLFRKILVAASAGAAVGTAWYYLTHRQSRHICSKHFMFESNYRNNAAFRERMQKTERSTAGDNSFRGHDVDEEGFIPKTPIQTKTISTDNAPMAYSADTNLTYETEEPTISEEAEARVILPPLDDETKAKFDM